MRSSQDLKKCHPEAHKRIYELWQARSGIRQFFLNESPEGSYPMGEGLDQTFICHDCHTHAKHMTFDDSSQVTKPNKIIKQNQIATTTSQPSSHSVTTSSSSSSTIDVELTPSKDANDDKSATESQNYSDLPIPTYTTNTPLNTAPSCIRGSIGTVYQQTNHNLKMVAVKMLNAKQLSTESLYELDNYGYMMTKEVNSPYLLELHDIIIDPPHYRLIMPFMKKGTLYDLIHNSEQPISQATQIKFAFQMASALQTLHENNIIHGEFKSNNIYLTDDNNLKVADYGLFFVKQEIRTRRSQTNSTGFSEENYKYYSPQLLEGTGENNEASDMYAYATVLWELLTRKKPWLGKNEFKVFDLVVKSGYHEPVPEDASEVLREIITTCWNHEPEKRYTAKTIVDKLAPYQTSNTNPLSPTIFKPKRTTRRKRKLEETKSQSSHRYSPK